MAGPSIGTWVKVKGKSGKTTAKVIPIKFGGGSYSQGEVITQSEFKKVQQARAEAKQQPSKSSPSTTSNKPARKTKETPKPSEPVSKEETVTTKQPSGKLGAMRTALASRDFDTLSNLSQDIYNDAKKTASAQNGKLDIGFGAGIGTGNDWVLSSLYRATGFDGKPQSLSKRELDAYSASGEITMYRGMGGASRQTFTKHFDSFRNGDYFAGNGTYGNGTYVAWADGKSRSDMEAASRVTKSYGSQAMVMTLRQGAVVRTQSELSSQMSRDKASFNEWKQTRLASAKNDKERTRIEREIKQTESVLWGDVRGLIRGRGIHSGRYAVIQGADAVKLDQSYDPSFMLLLNRSATRVATSSVDPGQI